VFLTKYYAVDQIKKKDGACSTYEVEERFMQGFGGET
jgi:hypothetical protein